MATARCDKNKPMCRTCPYYRPLHAYTGHGECRRHAPNPVVELVTPLTRYGANEPPPLNRYASGRAFASVLPDDWCGEHPDFSQLVLDTRRAQA